MPSLQLPASITARQRALLHAVAEAHGLGHASSGEGSERRMSIGDGVKLSGACDKITHEDCIPCIFFSKETADWHHAAACERANSDTALMSKQVDLNSAPDVSDIALCKLLEEHLGIDARLNFTSDSQKPDGRDTNSAPRLSLEQFVSVTRDLIELEREAEVQQAMEAAAVQSPEAAQVQFCCLWSDALDYVTCTLAKDIAPLPETRALCPSLIPARGITLLGLRCDDVEGGLLGRSLLTLVNNRGNSMATGAALLPAHKMSPHDLVAIRPSRGQAEGPPLVTGEPLSRIFLPPSVLVGLQTPREHIAMSLEASGIHPHSVAHVSDAGVIYRVRDTAIVVAVDDVPSEGLEQPLRLEKLANEVTYKRLKETLGALTAVSNVSGSDAPAAALVSVLFGTREPRFVQPGPSWTPFNNGLDDSQRAAVSLALAAKDIALVHGPPGEVRQEIGTGKTTAVVEIIRQEVKRGSRVLAVAASNIAVDNLVERLAAGTGAAKLRVVRMGHPARLLPQVKIPSTHTF
eukprot:366209-Chlamydomonas_euryale.AAC.5